MQTSHIKTVHTNQKCRPLKIADLSKLQTSKEKNCRPLKIADLSKKKNKTTKKQNAELEVCIAELDLCKCRARALHFAFLLSCRPISFFETDKVLSLRRAK